MKLQLALTFAFVLAAPCAFARPAVKGIDRYELEQSIETESGVDHQTAVGIVNALADQFRTQPGQPIPIAGYLSTRGFNTGLLIDTDTWYFNATLRDDAGNLVTAKNLYQVYFQNGGIKYEIAYKFMFVFLTNDMTIKQLDGAIFGRGLGFAITKFGGFELAYMPGKNRAGGILLGSLNLGFDTGVNFPRMTFRLRPVQP